MITIKTDRGWENPQTWKDVTSLPGYVSEIDPKVSELFAVIGKYREAERKVCSISTCHTKHNRGYIVSTKDGRVTNIGVICGDKHFGVDFEHMSRQLEKDWLNQQRRETVSTAKNKIEGWQRECEFLREPASWLLKQRNLLRNREEGLPENILANLLGLVRTGSNVLVRQRRATKQEQEIAREINNEFIEFVPEQVGTLNGLSGFGSIDQLREILSVDLGTRLKELAGSDVDQMTDKELGDWSKWTEEVDSKISVVKSIIDSSNLFFTQENFSLLCEIAEDPDEEKTVMNLAKQYS